jgi:hypothetical protein
MLSGFGRVDPGDHGSAIFQTLAPALTNWARLSSVRSPRGRKLKAMGSSRARDQARFGGSMVAGEITPQVADGDLQSK